MRKDQYRRVDKRWASVSMWCACSPTGGKTSDDVGEHARRIKWQWAMALSMLTDHSGGEHSVRMHTKWIGVEQQWGIRSVRNWMISFLIVYYSSENAQRLWWAAVSKKISAHCGEQTKKCLKLPSTSLHVHQCSSQLLRLVCPVMGV